MSAFVARSGIRKAPPRDIPEREEEEQLNIWGEGTGNRLSLFDRRTATLVVLCVNLLRVIAAVASFPAARYLWRENTDADADADAPT